MLGSQDSARQPPLQEKQLLLHKRVKRREKEGGKKRHSARGAGETHRTPRVSLNLGGAAVTLRPKRSGSTSRGPRPGQPALQISGQGRREPAGCWKLDWGAWAEGLQGRAARPGASAPARAAAQVTCEGVGIDGLQSLQLVALLLAVVCHRGPRCCCPCIGATPRRQAAADTAAAGCRAGARAESSGEKAWTHAWPRPAEGGESRCLRRSSTRRAWSEGR